MTTGRMGTILSPPSSAKSGKIRLSRPGWPCRWWRLGKGTRGRHARPVMGVPIGALPKEHPAFGGKGASQTRQTWSRSGTRRVSPSATCPLHERRYAPAFAARTVVRNCQENFRATDPVGQRMDPVSCPTRTGVRQRPRPILRAGRRCLSTHRSGRVKLRQLPYLQGENLNTRQPRRRGLIVPTLDAFASFPA